MINNVLKIGICQKVKKKVLKSTTGKVTDYTKIKKISCSLVDENNKGMHKMAIFTINPLS